MANSGVNCVLVGDLLRRIDPQVAPPLGQKQRVLQEQGGRVGLLLDCHGDGEALR